MQLVDGVYLCDDVHRVEVIQRRLSLVVVIVGSGDREVSSLLDLNKAVQHAGVLLLDGLRSFCLLVHAHHHSLLIHARHRGQHLWNASLLRPNPIYLIQMLLVAVVLSNGLMDRLPLKYTVSHSC